MKKKVVFAGMLVLVLAFGLVLAGCATTPPTPDKLAEQLAADINAIRAGSATAEGTTARLTGEVYLKTGLTVPAGVTLDLTADKVKFKLQNGAELTVDGTVNTSGHGDHGKGWVEGGLRIGEGTTVINGSGAINLKSKGCVLNIGDKRHLTLDGVTLVGLPDNDNSLVQVGGGGELVLKSGAITGNTHIGNTARGGGVTVQHAGSVFTMEGGEISGNSVSITEGANGGGGGVNVQDSGASFIMKGGKISGNNATGENDVIGGGVAIQSTGCVFTMEDGEISGNSVSIIGGGSGGGVGARRGIFTMSSGIISGNSVTGKDAKGGGVMSGDTFIMQGGTISGNSAIGESSSESGGGVFLALQMSGAGTFTMQGGTIYGSASVANAGDNANETRDSSGTPVTGRGAAISLTSNLKDRAAIVAKWGTGGTYTKGGVAQTGGSVIVDVKSFQLDDTLIATPAR